MRVPTVLALLGAAAHVVATAPERQLHDAVTVAVAVADRIVGVEGSFLYVDAIKDFDGEATPGSPVTADAAEPEKQDSGAGINTTMTLDAASWLINTTNTPSTPLPTEDADATTTDSEPAEVTGGALHQPMKASAAGLLGFFIMSLVML